jgi:hypothetical protein
MVRCLLHYDEVDSQPEGTWNWADVVQSHLQVLCTSTRQVAKAHHRESTNMAPPDDKRALQESFAELPRALRRICGEVTFPKQTAGQSWHGYSRTRGYFWHQ